MATYISDLVYYLQSFGVYDYLLPFFLVFTIIFAILEKTKLFGTELDRRPKTNINVVIALVIGLIVVANTEIALIMNEYLSRMALFIVIVLILVLTLGIFGANAEGGFSGIPFFIFMLISIGAVIWALSPTLGIYLPFYFSDQDKAVIFGLIVFFLIIGFVTRRESGTGRGWSGILDSVVQGFRGRP